MLEQDIGTLIMYSLSRISRLAEFSQFQEEQQKAINIFFQSNDISVSLPTGYGKSSIYQAAPLIDRLSSLEETGLYIYCAARRSLKLSQKTRCTILMYLCQEDCPPKTFGLFANGAVRLFKHKTRVINMYNLWDPTLSNFYFQKYFLLGFLLFVQV